MVTPISSRPARQSDAADEKYLLQEILRQVSRSFYLSLCLLPRTVRRQISLAYLFCRAADTLADTCAVPRHQRLQALELFRGQFLTPPPAQERPERLRTLLPPQHVHHGERLLLHYLPACFRILAGLSATDRLLIRELVLTLTRGMEMDLRCFPEDASGTIQALPDMTALDTYTYYVAGVVGRFWTDIHLAHLPAWQPADPEVLRALAIRFGKGLQMTNILKDLGKDLQRGRCYLPMEQLAQLGMEVGELRAAHGLRRMRPLLARLIRLTLEHLDCACAYIEQLPWRYWRVRVSCMWPLLFAVRTLSVVYQSEVLLQPERAVKISRGAVYRTMCASPAYLVLPTFFRRRYGSLRHQLLATLERSHVPTD